jgi:hypothetical protein
MNKEGKDVKKIGKICALVVVGIFVCMTLPMSAVAPPPLPFWQTEGNVATPEDVFGTLNEEDLRIITNGEQKMVITSGGNVGIGIAIPTEKLDVNGNIRASGHFIAGTTTTYGDGFIDISTGTNLDIDSGTLFIDNANDRVGIGTIEPQGRFQVESDPLSGTGTISSSGIEVTGTGTWFLSELKIGSKIIAAGETRTVTAITSYTDLEVDSAWIPDLSEENFMYINPSLFATTDGKIGVGTPNPGAKLDVELHGPYGTVGGAATIGHSLNSATGDYAVAMGVYSIASGYTSIAMGMGTTASGHVSTAMGQFTTASGSISTAMGLNSIASGWYSTAMGYGAKSSGWASTAMGEYTTASGYRSTALGLNTIAWGDMTTAMGSYTYAYGDYSTSMGSRISVYGDYSFGIGLDFVPWGQAPPKITQPNTMAIMGGKVGIGTVSPSYPLHVIGDFGFSGELKEGTIPWSLVSDFDGDPTPDDIADDGTITLGTETTGSYDSTPDTIADDDTITLGTETTGSYDSTPDTIADDDTITLGTETTGSYDSTPDTIADDGTITLGTETTGSYDSTPDTIADDGTITLGTETTGSYDSTPDDIADDGEISDDEASDVLTINNGLLYALTSGNVGIGTVTPSEKLDVEGNVHASGTFIAGSTTTYGDGSIALSSGTDLNMDSGTLFIDNTNNRVGIGTTNPGAKLDVIGSATIGSSANSATGSCAIAMGYETIANGVAPTAMGYRTEAIGSASTAMGYETTASGYYSTAMGYKTTASEWYSTAMGYETTAGGRASTAMGQSTNVTGDNSFGIGLDYNNDGWRVSEPNIMAIMGGNVGIGTTNPGAKLEIKADSDPPTDEPDRYSQIRIRGETDPNHIMFIGMDTTDEYGGISYLKELDHWGPLVLQAKGGNVGIGTTNPVGKLHVSGGNAIFDGNVGIGTASPSEKLEVQADSDDGQIRLSRQSNPDEQLLLGFHSSGYGLIQSLEQGVEWRNLVLNPSGGNVGIGTSYPQGLLHIRRYGDKQLMLGHSNQPSREWYFEIDGAATMTLGNEAMGSPITVMAFKPHNGNVGIGTTDPKGALDVDSTTGGFIVPRMTTTQRNALYTVNGMIIYNTSTNQFNFYENGAWVTK